MFGGFQVGAFQPTFQQVAVAVEPEEVVGGGGHRRRVIDLYNEAEEIEMMTIAALVIRTFR